MQPGHSFPGFARISRIITDLIFTKWIIIQSANSRYKAATLTLLAAKNTKAIHLKALCIINTEDKAIIDYTCNSSHPLLSQTFSRSSERLPTIAEVKHHIYTDRKWIEAGEFNQDKHQLTMQIRETYVGQSFVLLTDEFLQSLQQLCRNFKSRVELGAGIGWLGYWLGKYGITLQASIDNKSWSDFPQNRYLDLVQQMDSLEYVLLHPEVEFYILAWPAEDDLATRIWQSLLPGQHLLYIGEGKNGCTANDTFLEIIESHEEDNDYTRNLKQSFLSFDDFHDQPYLYKKI